MLVYIAYVAAYVAYVAYIAYILHMLIYIAYVVCNMLATCLPYVSQVPNVLGIYFNFDLTNEGQAR